MAEILHPIIQIAIIFPGTLLAYLPMKKHLRIQKEKLIIVLSFILLVLSIIGGYLCHLINLNALWILAASIMIISILYCYSLKISLWKSISIILAVCGVFSCIGSIANAINILLGTDNATLLYNLRAGVIYNLLCWIFVALVWYPATHAVRNLLEEEVIAHTWYVFWILPTVYIMLNLFIIPINPNIMYQGRLMQIYIVVSIILLVLLALFYALFYLMAKTLNRNDLLRQENQFLYMQQTQYESLCNAIEETRQARHDMRHHFSTLSVLANREEWQELKDYLSQAEKSIPAVELKMCDNMVVDGVVSHYCLRYKENEIPFSVELDLPFKLPISEMDMCLVLSNLLENALEASLRTEFGKRYIKIQAYLHSDNIALITVENAFDGIIKQKNGIYQSSKRHGDGIGIQSVCRIAEKNGGYCRFTLNDGIFSANVMLRGKGNSSSLH